MMVLSVSSGAACNWLSTCLRLGRSRSFCRVLVDAVIPNFGTGLMVLSVSLQSVPPYVADVRVAVAVVIIGFVTILVHAVVPNLRRTGIDGFVGIVAVCTRVGVAIVAVAVLVIVASAVAALIHTVVPNSVAPGLMVASVSLQSVPPVALLNTSLRLGRSRSFCRNFDQCRRTKSRSHPD